MKFELLPVLETMIGLYQKPRDFKRFEAYLQILEGSRKGSLATPVGGFNPMAKEHALEKLFELKNLEAEKIMADMLEQLNAGLKEDPQPEVFRVALNLSDDLHGGWTNRYTSDFDSKFRFHGIFKFHFCTPIFWTSEDFSVETIEKRTLEYACRTLYWRREARPLTFREHVEQEKWVAGKTNSQNLLPAGKPIWDFYEKHADSDDFHKIFWFLYGEEACEALGFPKFF